ACGEKAVVACGAEMEASSAAVAAVAAEDELHGVGWMERDGASRGAFVQTFRVGIYCLMSAASDSCLIRWVGGISGKARFNVSTSFSPYVANLNPKAECSTAYSIATNTFLLKRPKVTTYRLELPKSS
ncbi:hypothetical protein Vretimale_17420, partial [Volvox reticuliferus]